MITNADLDAQRISAIPTMKRWTEKERDHYQREVLLPGAPRNKDGSKFNLRIEQAQIAATYGQYGGVIANIDVGGGKTLASLLAAHVALKVRRLKRVILLVNSPLVPQLTKTDIPWAKQRVRMDYTPFNMHAMSTSDRIRRAEARTPGLYILPYSIVSRDGGLQILRSLRADLIVADECQTLANDTGRSKKFWGVIEEFAERGHRTELVGMSATLVRKHITELYDLFRIALGEMSPLPLFLNAVEDWDGQLGKTASGRRRPPNEKVQFLVDWAAGEFPEEHWQRDLSGVRTAWQRRFHTCPGVVSSDGASTTAKLKIHTKEAPPLNDHAQECLDVLEDAGMLPNGEFLPTEMHIATEARRMSNGFWHALKWRRSPETDPYLDENLAYHALRNSFNGMVQKWIRQAPLGQDTPGDVVKAILETPQDVPLFLHEAYAELKAKEPDVLIVRDSVPVWMDRSKMKYLAELAIHTKAPIWCHHHAIHHQLRREFFERGVRYEDILEQQPTDNLRDPDKATAKSGVQYIMSAKKCSEGLNLQHHPNTIFGEVVRNGSQWHQMLGRNHRQGQTSEEVLAFVPLTNDVDLATLGAALIEAVNIHQLMGNDHKAVLAAWDPPPELPTPEHIRAKVPDAESLSGEARKLFLKRFGIH